MRTKNTSNRKMFLATSVIIAIVAVMIFSAIGTSIWGVELHGVEQEIAQIEGENRRLNAEIVSQMSLTVIYENIDDLGYVKPEVVLYPEGEKAVAQLH